MLIGLASIVGERPTPATKVAVIPIISPSQALSESSDCVAACRRGPASEARGLTGHRSSRAKAVGGREHSLPCGDQPEGFPQAPARQRAEEAWIDLVVHRIAATELAHLMP
jgi:hypothetical protein